jgi:FkbM family methyltransferase
MERIINFTYNQIDYKVYENSDLSLNWSIQEIVDNDEYLLTNFQSNDKSVFIDIGANNGIATLILAKQNPNSVIYSFEPDPKLFNILVKNVELNELQNIKLSNKGVSNETKLHNLYLHPHFSGGNTTCTTSDDLKLFFGQDINVVQIECISFDDIIKNNNIENVKLLKIDCEGAEYEILYNSKLFKNGYVANMVGEFHNLGYNTQSKNDIEELVKYSKQYVNGLFKITEYTYGSMPL